MKSADKFWKGEKVVDVDYEVDGKKPVKEKPKKVKLDGEKIRDGLAQLVLTVVELLRELMEKQALRRMEHGSLTEDQIENLGNTFMALKNEIDKLKKHFNLEDEDLNLDLGPLTVREEETGKASVVEILDRLLGKGVVVKGDIILSVAEVDLVSLNLGLLLASIDKARELYGHDVNTQELEEEVKMLRDENKRLKDAKD